MSSNETLRLLFVDDGEFHHESVTLPSAALDRWERVIDALREDEEILRILHVDLNRLCAAYRLTGDEED